MKKVIVWVFALLTLGTISAPISEGGWLADLPAVRLFMLMI